MRPYLSIVVSRFQMLLQYRAAAVAGVVTQIFWGIVRTMIFDAFYRSSSGSQPLTHDQTLTYIWLGQVTLPRFDVHHFYADIRRHSAPTGVL